MAYSVCHAPLESLVRCYLKFVQWKSVIFSNLLFSNNLILCCMSIFKDNYAIPLIHFCFFFFLASYAGSAL